MQIECLDLTRLPASNRLFLDFNTHFDKVSSWYQKPPQDNRQWQARADEVRSLGGFSRATLLEALSEYNGTLPLGAETRENLNRLREPDAVAVVSGQQVGLFGGPAYTVYKAAGTIQLARELRATGINAVPLFWLATNDSDFEEIRSTQFLDVQQAEPLSFKLSDGRQHAGQVTGSIPLTGVDQLLRDLAEGLSEMNFREQAVGALAEAYQPETTLGHAFASWLARLFRDHGLIFIDPMEENLCRNLSEFYCRAVDQRERLMENLLERGRELERAGYQPQVQVEESESLIFLVEGQKRTKLKFENNCYRAKGRPDIQLTPAELKGLAAKKPESLSPGVLIRPVLQDYLLPTLVYIGGPAEIAYFAQVQAIASVWKRKPLILPRASLTIVDRKSQRLLRKYGLSVLEILSNDARELSERIVRTTEATALLNDFDELERDLRNRFEKIEQGLDVLDPTLIDMLSGVRDKMLYQLGKLSGRFVANQKRQQPVLEKHLQHLLNRLNPAGSLQERVFGFSQFSAEEGPDLLDQLIPHLKPSPCHKICYL